MERKDVLKLSYKKTEIVYEQIILEGKRFYVQRSTESLFAEEGHFTTISPLYTSIEQLLDFSKHNIFEFEPDYIDSEIWNELSECYSQYCEETGVEIDENENWSLALGINSVEHIFDALDSLGISKDDASTLCEIMCQIKMDSNREKEVDALLKDPMAFEGGGPGTRELLLLLAKEIQG